MTRTSNRLQFAALSEKNLGQLRELNAHCFPIAYREPFYEQLLSSKYVQLGYCADALVGAIACMPHSGPQSGNQFYIMLLGVLDHYRRKGFASQLLDWAIEKARNQPDVKEVVLHVQTNNESALSFYKKMGFRIQRTDEDYYPQLDPSSAHFLVKRI